MPVKTRDLVLAPMFVSLLSVTSPVLVFWIGVMLPLGFKVPVLLPFLLLTLIVVGSQASSWLMNAKSFYGCLFLPISLFGPVLGIVAWVNHVPQLGLSAAAGFFILLSVYVSLTAAPFARHSVTFYGSMVPKDRGGRSGTSFSDSGPIEARFETPIKAQVWGELARKPYLGMAVIVGMACFVLFLVCLFYDATPSVRLGVGDIEIGISTRLFLLCIPITLFFSSMFSSNSPANPGMSRAVIASGFGMEPFLAIRPMPSAYFVIAKLIANVKTAFITSWILGVSLVLCLLAPAKENGRYGDIASILATHASVRGLLVSTLLILSIPLLIWSFLAGDPTRAMFHKKLGNFLSVARIIFVVFLYELIRDFPKMDTETFGNYLPVIIAIGFGLVGIKAILVVVAAIRLRSKDLIEAAILTKALSAWALVAVFLVASFYLLLPPDLIPISGITIIVALLMPANRILWQILALDATRHQ